MVRPLFLALVAAAETALAQLPPDLAAERAEFARWLLAARNSPFAAVYQQPLSGEVALGVAGEPVLGVLPPGTLYEGAVQVRLRTPDGERVIPRHRDVPLGAWIIRVSGERGRSTLTVFGPLRGPRPPEYHPYDAAAIVDGVLEPPPRPEQRRMLGLDGIETTGSLAGTFAATFAGRPLRLTVYRMSEPGSEESELQLFFRDGTNDSTTYPAGRFVALRPLGGNRWRADFNRARNPWCAYNTVFACPIPWQGNTIEAPVQAGEKYRRASGTRVQ
jgi:hypothetical protein